MTEQVFIAIDGDALYDKSKVYLGRALRRKSASELDEYQLWASLALELLGKAALARKHPSLVVDPNDWRSMFVAAGINVSTDVRTITAHTLFERLKHLVPRFDETLKTFCLAIASRRNKELHSAELPFQSMRLDAWEAQYWHACDTILHQMGSSLEEWMGATDAVAPRQVLMEAENALKSAVQLRVKAAAEKFKGQTNAERGRLAADAQLRVLEHQTALFKGSYDNIWAQDCPACNCRAFMAGEQSGEFIEEGSTYFDDERDEDIIWEFVHRQFFGAEFRCPTCDLGLMGSDEIEAADLNYIHRDTTEREMAYEPDYGND